MSNAVYVTIFLKEHWKKVSDIYKEGIETKNATFRTKVADWEEWNDLHYEHSRFVAVENKRIIGWCAIAPVSNRYEYRGVAEVSVYVKLDAVGKKVGSLLMNTLIKSANKEGIWTLYSSLFPENIASIKLHEKNDFRLIGFREKIAQLDGVWRDTVLYERRKKSKEN